MYIKLLFDVSINKLVIPTATDGTVGRLPDNHPAVTKMVMVNNPPTITGYNGAVYSIRATDDPFSRHPFDNGTCFYIKV